MITVTNDKVPKIYVQEEYSATIAAVFARLDNGQMKSYILRTGKHGNISAIADDEVSKEQT